MLIGTNGRAILGSESTQAYEGVFPTLEPADQGHTRPLGRDQTSRRDDGEMNAAMTSWDVRQGHVLDELRKMEPESVHCVVTSPPYYGLRDYGLPSQVWGGEPDCNHEFGPTIHGGGSSGSLDGSTLQGTPAAEERRQRWESHVCCDCGAWSGSLGLEPSVEMYVEHLVEVFREVWRVLRPDGTLWLNMGDSYVGSWGNYHPFGTGGQRSKQTERWERPGYSDVHRRPPTANMLGGLKRKDLIGMPWRVALALQTDGVADLHALDIIQRIRAEIVEDHQEHGETPSDRVLAILDRLNAEYAEAKGESWWLRSDIIWRKLNPMPSSTPDRPTPAHEYVFLMSRSARYYYDRVAIREPYADSTIARVSQTSFWDQTGGEKDYGATGVNANRSARRALENVAKRTPGGWNVNHDESDLKGSYPQKTDKQRGHSRAPRWIQRSLGRHEQGGTTGRGREQARCVDDRNAALSWQSLCDIPREVS